MCKKRMLLFILLFAGMNLSAQTADLFIENKTTSGGYFYFEIHITPTSDWGAGNRKALGDCSWYFAYNAAALSSPTLFYANPTYVPTGAGYTNSTGITGGKVQVTTDLDSDTYDGVEIPTGQKTHVYTVRMTVDNSALESDLIWDEVNTGIYTAREANVVESYNNNGDMSLPVELRSFSALYMEEGVRIQWATESETDNAGFILERALKWRSIAPLQWDEIASYETCSDLQGQGNSSVRHEYVFVDVDADAGQCYQYRLSDVNTSGEVHVYDILEITLPDAPAETELKPPFPNPFNPETRIVYQLSKSGPVKILIYDLLGRKVRTLVNKVQSPGSYNVYWHGDDVSGRQTATGTYLIALKTVEGMRMQKVLMIR